MEIKVLGTGCQKCQALEKIVREVVAENGLEAEVNKVDDIIEIMGYGVVATPALLIDGKIAFKGRVPSSKEILNLLTQ